MAHRRHENARHTCALCGAIPGDQTSPGRHVARHLQELALFILPRNEVDSDGEESRAPGGARSTPGRPLLVIPIKKDKTFLQPFPLISACLTSQ